MGKAKKQKYKVGEMVYNWQSPNKKVEVNRVRLSDDGDYPHLYRLTLIDKDGNHSQSKWTSESSLYKIKRNKPKD